MCLLDTRPPALNGDPSDRRGATEGTDCSPCANQIQCPQRSDCVRLGFLAGKAKDISREKNIALQKRVGYLFQGAEKLSFSGIK